MSFLTANYKENQSNNFGALPSGNYEMVIANAKEDATPNGAETFQIDLIVRNDLTKVPTLAETNGEYANRHVFNDNWKRKATKQYDLEGFQYILEAVGVPEGTQINSIDDFAKLIIGKPVKVYVKKQYSDYKKEDENTVAPWSYSQTDFPQVQHQYKDKKDNPASNANEQVFEQNENATTITDEDLPF